jgi:hypothetical protein
MKRTFITILSSLAVAASLGMGSASAQGRGAGAGASAHAAPPSQAHPSMPAHKAAPEGAASNTPAPMTVAQRIDAHPQLVTRLTPLVPKGMTLDQAAAGFKNQGQFIAALHVSHNLDIPFATLKAEMTGPDHDSLGKAIRDLQPAANAKAEAKKAENEADADLKAAGKPNPPKKTDTDKDGK